MIRYCYAIAAAILTLSSVAYAEENKLVVAVGKDDR